VLDCTVCEQSNKRRLLSLLLSVILFRLDGNFAHRTCIDNLAFCVPKIIAIVQLWTEILKSKFVDVILRRSVVGRRQRLKDTVSQTQQHTHLVISQVRLLLMKMR